MTMKKHVVSLAVAASLASVMSLPAAAADATDAPGGTPALGDKENPTSGPGVQGHPGTRTGPAARQPDDASEGASEGSEGLDQHGTTLPSQDSSGVKGFPDTRTGPAEHRSEEDKGKMDTEMDNAQ